MLYSQILTSQAGLANKKRRKGQNIDILYLYWLKKIYLCGLYVLFGETGHQFNRKRIKV